MVRRALLLFFGAAAGWPFLVNAQQPQTPVIGFLRSLPPLASEPPPKAFNEGLQSEGYFHGRNVWIEQRGRGAVRGIEEASR